ncbi:MAG: phosphomethylpyrimidine synthase ThiC [Actinobacteria bacterium]|nr:phosphomethylpyrimidine synthase ThiC [Actinomycetota bacterium]MCL5883458.1 phosphomethylpyrimidine synthase ThiC [Actinomycetota bacterium]
MRKRTMLDRARDGEITDEMRSVAAAEGVEPEFIRRGIEKGNIVVLTGDGKPAAAVGIGKGLRAKVNASIGTSSDIIDLDMELEKASVAREYGADTLMELSTAGDLDDIRRSIVGAAGMPVGSVPLYQAGAEASERLGAAVDMSEEMLFEIIERQAADGIGFMAIHCGVNRQTVDVLQSQGRRNGGLVSRGGAFMISWMEKNGRENPLFEEFDRLLEILREYEVVLSLGNGMRAGATADSTDQAQIQELLVNCALADRARDAGVQAMLEGPGHIPIDEIEANVVLQKKMSRGKPFYMLGPITTDIAPGYDHITAAIGSAWAVAYGTDFICYVTPAEHLGLPFKEDVREGVIAARLAVHVGDMIRLGRRNRDLAMGEARRSLDWEAQFALALDPGRARSVREARPLDDPDGCSMCGDQCSLRRA